MSYPRLAAAFILAVSSTTTAFAQFKRDAPIRCEDVDSVGTAQMSTAGVITLRLHSLWPEPNAESVLTYEPDDPQYEEIKHHLGGISPGESKPVPPLCGLNSEP